MKKAFVIGLLMAFVLTSCQNTGIEVLTQKGSGFTAVVEDSLNDDTKTSMNGEGNVLWKKGDQVSIFFGNTLNEQYQVTDESEGKRTASLYKVSSSSGFISGTDIDNNVAFYPYSSSIELTESEGHYVISDIVLPATQSHAEGSFGNGTFPMVAVTGFTGDMNLKFKNVLGGLKLQLKGTATITSISLSGNNNEILCGAAEVTTTYGGVPSISLSDASARTVTLDCGAGVALNTETATPFIIALPPMNMEGGFTVIVTDSDGKQMEIKTTRTQTIPRSNLLRMPAVIYEGLSPVTIPDIVDLGLSVKWASFNFGASSPEERGYKIAWGEIEPKSNYEWSTYKYCNGSSNTLTNYCNNSGFGYNGYTDSKVTLDITDDVARVRFGEIWRMPTDAEWTELREQCSWTWTNQNGVDGYEVKSKTNNKSIFIPITGFNNGTLSYNEFDGYYWSSSLDTDDPRYAWIIKFTPSKLADREHNGRRRGLSVRPVSDEGIIKVTNVMVSLNEAKLKEGDTLQLTATVYPTNANQKSVTWSSSNEAVATVSDNGLVVAISAGSTIITTTTVGSGLSATCSLTVLPFPVPIPTAVDLGLSVKWASFNIGASSPEEYGDYYAWGETKPKSDYSWSTYKYGTKTSGPFSKYNTKQTYGTVDNKITLEPEDDVAQLKLGDNWRMPTDVEWVELEEQCTWDWTTENGVNGYLVTSKTNGNSIFLPAAGDDSHNAEFCGYYWSSSLNVDEPHSAWYKYFKSSDIYMSSTARCCGHSVRPVSNVKISSIEISTTEAKIKERDTLQLKVTVYPTDASQQAVTWSSSNEAVATVDNSGLVVAYSVGTASITATTVDGGFTATCAITVLPAPTFVFEASAENFINALNQVCEYSGEGNPVLKLTEDIIDFGDTLKLTNKYSKPFKLDLNGHIITSAINGLIVTNGTLIIMDSGTPKGKISSTESKIIDITKAGTLVTLDGCVIESTKETGTAWNSDAAISVSASGSILNIINGAKVYTTNKLSTLRAYTGTVTIDDSELSSGTLTEGWYVIMGLNSSSVTVNSGSFFTSGTGNASTFHIASSNATMTINGGYFHSLGRTVSGGNTYINCITLNGGYYDRQYSTPSSGGAVTYGSGKKLVALDPAETHLHQTTGEIYSYGFVVQ